MHVIFIFVGLLYFSPFSDLRSASILVLIISYVLHRLWVLKHIFASCVDLMKTTSAVLLGFFIILGVLERIGTRKFLLMNGRVSVNKVLAEEITGKSSIPFDD